MDIRTFRSFVKTAMALQADQDTPGDYIAVRAAVEAKFGLTKEAVGHEWIKKMIDSGAPKASTERLEKFIKGRHEAVDNILSPFNVDISRFSQNRVRKLHPQSQLANMDQQSHQLGMGLKNIFASNEAERHLLDRHLGDLKDIKTKIKDFSQSLDSAPAPKGLPRGTKLGLGLGALGLGAYGLSRLLKKEKHAGYGNHIGLAGLGTLALPSVANMAGHPMSEKNKDRAEVVGLGVLGGEYAHNIAAARSARYAKSGIGQRLGRILSH